MSSELERYKAALEVARVALADLSGADNRAYTGRRCVAAIDQIDRIIHPPTEWDDVPIERWAVIATSGYVATTYATKELAEHEVAADGIFKGYEVTKLTGTIRRAKSAPVERSVSVEAISLNGIGQIHYSMRHMLMFKGAEGKTVTLTATWTE